MDHNRTARSQWYQLGLVRRERSRWFPTSYLGAVLILGMLSGCEGSSLGDAVERSLAADPRLATPPADVPSDAPAPDPSLNPSTAFPNAGEEMARLVGRLGQEGFMEEGDRRSHSPANENSDDGTVLNAPDLAALPEDLRDYVLDVAELGILTLPSASLSTQLSSMTAPPTGLDRPDAASPSESSSPEASSSDPSPASERTGEAFPSQDSAEGETEDESTSAGSVPTPGAFLPNEPVTRREFVRWLVSANNLFFQDRPSDRLRLSPTASLPAFQDVQPTDPDFAMIQGLAEAGILDSALSGEGTATLFRPDAPLTREDLLRWKVPLDIRQPLPVATVAAIEQTWGFQDAAQLDPNALQAVLADYQNGDRSNIRRAFGFTRLLQPKRPVTRAEAAAVVWYFGYQGDGRSARDLLRSEDAPPPASDGQTGEGESMTDVSGIVDALVPRRWEP